MFRQLQKEDILFQPLRSNSWKFYGFVAILFAVIGWAAYAYSVQLRDGLVVTGLRDYIFWGIYMTNFVFFIGISHAGTLISAILRVTGAEWRRPITRMAEAITVFALLIGGPMIIIDMGHPERLLNLLQYGRIQSPILWDLISITTYIAGSMLYLYLPMIPDLAECRDRLTDAPAWKRFIYRTLSLDWRGDAEQKRRLEKGVGIMAVLIIPVAVSVHTVVSWIFGMTMRPGWHSTIFGPYFVVGAIFSGIAAILIAMVIFRRVYHLEAYLTEKVFRNLGLLLLVMDVVYIYFTLSEYLTMTYGNDVADQGVVQMLFVGDFAPIFWAMILGGFIFPGLMLALPNLIQIAAKQSAAQLVLRPLAAMAAVAVFAVMAFAPTGASADFQVTSLWSTLRVLSIVIALGGLFWLMLPVMKRHPLATIATASLLINIAMWLKRYIIIVPTLYNPRIPIQNVPSEWAQYTPTWVEWSITAGAFAMFILLYTLFSKMFPVVSIWETSEEAHTPVTAHVAEGGANV
ncbi:MAG: polysulfide reductase NrfD [Chloroflexi bacterium]|nr:polysulfide reductase NrfD [Chloroflexota bacterium]